MSYEIKTTFYDLIGYLFPGYIGLFVVYFVMHFHGDFVICFKAALNLIESFKVDELIFLTIIAYVLGHIISSTSNLLFEVIICKIFKVDGLFKPEKILGADGFSKFKNKFVEVYELQFTDKLYFIIVGFVESRQKEVYSTAFIFLSIYGMARCFALLFLAFSIWLLFYPVYIEALIFFTAALILFYEYLRFTRYYWEEILSGFLLPEKKSDEEDDDLEKSDK